MELHLRVGDREPLSDNGKEDSKKRTAIIAGINRYESESNILTLKGAENDANEVCERLRKTGNFEVPDERYLIGTRATRKNILKAVSDVFRRDNNYDVVALYFSGHGIVDKNKVGYIAPYDMDPEDPFVSGINMEQLRNVIYESTNKASVIMLLDCCHSGIAAKDKIKSGRVTGAVLDRDRNLISTQFQKMVESPGELGTEPTTRGAVILASSEADAVSRERDDYKHSENGEPHSHGAFTFHLIEGLDGRAAEDSGVVTIGSLKKYIEDRMVDDRRQIPVHYVAGASRIDSIHLAISEDQFRDNVARLLKTARDGLGVKYANSELLDLQSLTIAAKKIGELDNLNHDNSELARLREAVESGLAAYQQPSSEWLDKNFEYRLRINTIKPELFERVLPDMIYNLSFNELQKMDQNAVKALTILLAEVARNTEFKGEDDKNLNRFYNQLRAAIRVSQPAV